MWRSMIRKTGMIVALLLIGSCFDRNAQLAADLQKLQEITEELAKRNAELVKEQEHLVRLVRCPNPKVRQFMRSCASGLDRACTPQDSEHALLEMTSFPYVMLYADPRNETPFALSRIGQIKSLLASHSRLSTTRLLVVAMPASESAIDTHLAEVQALKLRKLVTDTIYPSLEPGEPGLPSLPPLIVSCRERVDVLRKYADKKSDVLVLPGEPKRTQKRMILWTFIVDC